ncbi:undecaprenyl-diphosphate phosphatase [uncultured Roseovarius sp.]|uniref:undecaprenyl-diphosphate phosphatase n=1 Tax=uncultured Roseovarius sp. TaxID=293344 RepID=UPI002625AC45|nr:undecaprenyl-diphosphate phosphatase [uncultured Roseovarius sp.]
MALFHIFLVAIVQGITEFLPISSSGHLILLPNLLGIPDQGLVIDVAVHVGTLFAVMIYFWSDLRGAVLGLPRLISGRADTPGARLALLLIVSSVPVMVCGLLLKLSGLDEALRSIAVIGWTTLIFGVLLYWADQTGKVEKASENWNMRDAIVLGLWQAIALIPGTSRSGITITGARFMGYARQDAARISMLMSVPTIIASGVLLGGEVAMQADLGVLRDGAIAAAFAFVAALLALSLMMRLLRSLSFTPYVVYRLILGVTLLTIAYT